MQLVDRVNYCNGCAACVVPCKLSCVKMYGRTEEEVKTILENAAKPQGKDDTKKVPFLNEGGCSRCNACVLYCPIYNPIDMPTFTEWYEYDEKFDVEDKPQKYREAMRGIRAGQHTEFIGTLCEIAALISLMGGRIAPNLILKPMLCDAEKREKEECCKHCIFY